MGGRIFNIESVDSGSGNPGDPPGSATKNFKFGGGAGSVAGSVAMAMGSSTPNMSTPSANKVKASHKLKAQTSRIVSSFKQQQSVVCSVVREYNGHKVGALFFENYKFYSICLLRCYQIK